MKQIRSKGTENVPSGVGEKMRIKREDAGLTLEQVARKIKTSKGHLSNAETGQGNLGLPLFIAYCKAIDTPMSEILGDGFLAKERDFERLAYDLRKLIGTDGIAWLCSLSKQEARLALERAGEAIIARRAKSQASKPCRAGAPITRRTR